MKVTYRYDGAADEFAITHEAESPEEMVELKEAALRIAQGEPSGLPEPCPRECGGVTEDPGDPCRACEGAS